MKSQQKNNTQYAQRINRVLAHIQAHLDEPLSLAELSKVACFSPFHFHRQFTACTGETVKRVIQLLRMQRASMQLVFNPRSSITAIALDAGFASAESFSRAFKKLHGQTPSGFRQSPDWQSWQIRSSHRTPQEYSKMKVELIDFPATLVAALEHHGPERDTFKSSMKFIEWRQANGIRPDMGATYGIHYSDPVSTLPEDYRLDICVSVDKPVADNPQGVITKTIPAGRCARARHPGSRHHVAAAEYLYREWLPHSGEQLRDFPVFFHYVNVGPDIKDKDMITDVYLPLV